MTNLSVREALKVRAEIERGIYNYDHKSLTVYSDDSKFTFTIDGDSVRVKLSFHDDPNKCEVTVLTFFGKREIYILKDHNFERDLNESPLYELNSLIEKAFDNATNLWDDFANSNNRKFNN